MNPRLYIVALLCASLCACTGTKQKAVSIRSQAKPAEFRIAQIDHGKNARFVLCNGAECPKVTQKTLAIVSADRTATQPVPTPLPAREFDEAVPPTEETVTVLFAKNSAVLDQRARALLDAQVSRLGPKTSILVRGRTDSTGSKRMNDRLAERRAQAVTNYVKSKIPQREVEVRHEARGKCCYVAPNKTAAGRAVNRRAEVAARASAPARRGQPE